MQLSLCLLHFETKPNSHSFSIMFSYFLFLFKRGYAWNFYFFFVFCQKVRHSRTLQSINFHVCFSRSPVWIFASSAAAWKKNLHAVKKNCNRHKTTVVCQVTDCRFIKMKTVITMNAMSFFIQHATQDAIGDLVIWCYKYLHFIVLNCRWPTFHAFWEILIKSTESVHKNIDREIEEPHAYSRCWAWLLHHWGWKCLTTLQHQPN